MNGDSKSRTASDAALNAHAGEDEAPKSIAALRSRFENLSSQANEAGPSRPSRANGAQKVVAGRTPTIVARDLASSRSLDGVRPRIYATDQS